MSVLKTKGMALPLRRGDPTFKSDLSNYVTGLLKRYVKHLGYVQDKCAGLYRTTATCPVSDLLSGETSN